MNDCTVFVCEFIELSGWPQEVSRTVTLSYFRLLVNDPATWGANNLCGKTAYKKLQLGSVSCDGSAYHYCHRNLMQMESCQTVSFLA